MNFKPYIPKENMEIPDSYGATITCPNGDKEELELGAHKIVDKTKVYKKDGYFKEVIKNEKGESVELFYDLLPSYCPYLELVLFKDRFRIVPFFSFSNIEFDERYSKIVALKEKEMLKK